MHLCDVRYQKQIFSASGLFPPPQRIQSVLSICFFSKVFYCTITHNSQLLVGFAQKLECLTVCSRKEHIKKQACNIDPSPGLTTASGTIIFFIGKKQLNQAMAFAKTPKTKLPDLFHCFQSFSASFPFLYILKARS